MNIAEFYNKLSDQERKIFYVTIIALVLSFFDMLFLRPVLSRLAELEEDARSTSLAIERDIRFISYHDKIMAEDEAFRLYKTDESKTSEEIISGFLRTVEVMASEVKINLSRVTPADVKTKKGFVQYFANVDCSGKLEDMISFMYRIDSTDNLLKIVRMNMTGNKARKEDVKVEMKLAKLVIDPASIGNYEFDSKNIDMPQALLEEAAASIGLPGSNSSRGSSRRGGKMAAGRGSASGRESGGKTGDSDQSADEGEKGTGSAGSGGSGQGGTGAGGAGVSGSGGSGEDGGGAGGSGAGSGEGGGGEAAAGEDLHLGKRRPAKSQRQQETEQYDQSQKQSQAESKTQKEKNKLQKSLQNAKKGGRVRVESIDALWGKFVNKILGREDDLEPVEDGEYIEEAYETEDQRNLWERKMR